MLTLSELSVIFGVAIIASWLRYFLRKHDNLSMTNFSELQKK